MKIIIILFVFFINTIGFAQINSFSKTTQLLNKPHGKPILQINAGVEYWRIKNENDSSWTKIIVPCFVKQSEIQTKELSKHTVLFNCNGDSIGICLQKNNIDTFRHACCVNFHNSSDFKFADFVGYVETAHLPGFYPIAELQKDPDSFSDSCISRIYNAVNTEGVEITVNEDCRLYFELLNMDNNLELVLVKELKTTTSYFTVDTKDVKMTLFIIRNFNTDHPEIHEITSDSYECEFKNNIILFKESKWYAPAHYHMYSTSTFKEIMKYQDQLFTLEIPGSNTSKPNRKAYIGYFINYKNRDQAFNGTLTLTDGQTVLNHKTILCANPEVAGKIYCCTGKMQFIAIHPDDEVFSQDPSTLMMKSKTGNCDADCFSDFRIHFSFLSEGETISLELEFRDGDVFIVKNYMDAFELK
ncbi:MAG: hypothetical protein AB7V36_05750 [Bacteroidales bacterium]